MSQIHPELQDGETLIGIFSEKTFKLISWETKRMGNPVTDDSRCTRYPVFVRTMEIKARADARGMISLT